MYSLRDNIISFLLGAVIAIPVIILAYKDKPTVKTYEVTETIETVASDPRPTREAKVISKEWIDGGYGDREYLGDFTVTGYCPCVKCCEEWADGITYTGTIATEGRTIAVDPEVIPLGSIVEINGINYLAEDIGGAVEGNHVDIFFNSHKDAYEYGVQEYAVYMVEECID